MYNALVKARNKKGFTLMEMLIVVAIIAILVAISIPTFSSQLNKARKATDDANLRAAKAVFTTAYLTDDDDDTFTVDTLYYYDAVKGVLTTTVPTAYGKVTGDNYVVGKVTEDGTVSVAWNELPADE